VHPGAVRDRMIAGPESGSRAPRRPRRRWRRAAARSSDRRRAPARTRRSRRHARSRRLWPFEHRLSRPLTQFSHAPHDCTNGTGDAAAGRELRHALTDALDHAADSWPSVIGNCGFNPSQARSSFQRCQSLRHTPQAVTRTSASPGPGSGIGTSSIRSGSRKATNRAAFIRSDGLSDPSRALLPREAVPQPRSERTSDARSHDGRPVDDQLDPRTRKPVYGDQAIVSRSVEGPIHRYTYRDLAARSAQLAHALRALGVEPGDRVATLAWNTYRHVELYYGVGGDRRGLVTP